MIKCSHEKVKDDISCCEHALVVDIGNIECNAVAGMCQHQCPCAPKAKELAATDSQHAQPAIAELVRSFFDSQYLSVDGRMAVEAFAEYVQQQQAGAQ